jgi:hypothetical protein
MLFDSARADAQLPGDFLVAATLDQQIEHLLIPRRYFNSIDIHHRNSPSADCDFLIRGHICVQAHASPNLLPQALLLQDEQVLALRDTNQGFQKKFRNSVLG